MQTKKGIKKQFIFLIVLIVLAIVIQFFVFYSIAAEKRENRKQETYIYGQGIADSIKLTLDNSVDSTETLKVFYNLYGEGCFEVFDEIASQVYEENPVIGSLYLAPKGVIQAAYPEETAKSTMGFAMLEDPRQGPRAQLAVDTRKVTVAGPHALVEGGKGLIIRNPLFEDDEFVGFTVAVLDWDRFVNQALDNLSASSERYKFAVYRPDVDQTAIADQDGYILRNTSDQISKNVDIEFTVPNDVWHLVVEPVIGWAVFNEMKEQIATSAVASIVLIILSVFLYASEQKKILLSEQVRENVERERYMTKLAEALKTAEDANAAKTNFLNNMTHDIRTPMNAILGFTTLMEKEIDQPDKLKEYLEKIHNSGDYLLNLINNMLEVARIDSGKESIDECFIDLLSNDFSIIPLLENEIKKKNLVFTNNIDIENRYVFADLQKIKEITMNLMSNAIKYTPEGGSIHMDFVEYQGTREGYATYVLEISDTGIGMSEEFQKQIFDSFSRERNTTESKVIGTGLGMSIVKKLVELMGGTVEVESELGKGTRFIVTMEYRIVDDPEKYLEIQQQEVSVQEVNLEGNRILLAEDNELNAEIAMTILSEAGLQVEHAWDGVECVNMLLDREPGYYDLILMDVQMPNLNGYDATRRIRSMTDLDKANIPILAMTANAFEEDKRIAFEAGMNGHLAKPINLTELMTALVEVLLR